MSEKKGVNAQENLENSVEVFIKGKKYDSFNAFKSEKLKEKLSRVLAEYNLGEFEEKELFDIIADVRKAQIKGESVLKDSKVQEKEDFLDFVPDSEENEQFSYDFKPVKGNRDNDLEKVQMRQMLKDYYDNHKEANPLSFDPNRVKNIIIQPKK